MDVLSFWVAAAAFLAAWYIARGMPIGSFLLYRVALFSALAVIAATGLNLVEWPASSATAGSLEEHMATPETPAEDLDCEYVSSGIPHDGHPEVSCDVVEK